MKIPFPLPIVVCLFALAGSALAEEGSAPPQAEPRRILRPPLDATPAPAKLTRFDLDFPGGTPAELAAAMSKAMGRHLNLVIPTELDDLKIVPLKVEGVTVPEVFAALSIASAHTEALRTSNGYEFKDVVIRFTNPLNALPTDETVWALQSSGFSQNVMAKVYGVAPVCRYFQLASYLENYSIEDITTAIQTGWKMAKVEPMPQLSFHKETSLLIAVGPEASVNQIPDVLGQLRNNRGAAVERIVKLQAELDDALTKQGAGWDKKEDELRREIREIAARQKANEEIDNGGRRQIRPAPVGTN